MTQEDIDIMAPLKRIPGGPHQLNIGLSDEQYQILVDYMRIKELASP